MGEADQADVSAIRSLIQQMIDASCARDSEAFVGLFTEDVVAMMPDQLPIIGKDAWRASVQGPFDRSSVEQLNMPSEEIVIAGDRAFERHNETAVLIDKADGQRRRTYAKGIWILRRQADGSWKFARYIYNLNPLRRLTLKRRDRQPCVLRLAEYAAGIIRMYTSPAFMSRQVAGELLGFRWSHALLAVRLSR